MNKKLCPICGNENNCAIENGEPSHSCWCIDYIFPKDFKRNFGGSCICMSCIDKMKEDEDAL